MFEAVVIVIFMSQFRGLWTNPAFRYLGLPARRRTAPDKCGRCRETNGMANALTAPRRVRGPILVALLALTLAVAARAEESNEPKPEQPARAEPSDAARAPSGQKGGRSGGQAAAPAASDQ